MTISGTATDAGGGRVAGVEVSTDGGQTWHPAAGTATWSYTWIANGYGEARIRVARRGRQRKPRDSAPGDNGQRRLPVLDLGQRNPARRRRVRRLGGDRSGSQIHGERRRLRHRCPFLQGCGEYGHAIGSLWSAQGALLARATFTGESASGWQQVNFANPVAVSAGTTYLASYYAPNGHYALNLNYFTNAYSNGPLHALGNSQDSNGVYRYAAAPSFPDQTWQASNYWVDVVFTTDAPQDTTAPTVTDVTPAAATTDVPTTTTVTATFDEALNPTTVTTTTFQLRDNAGTLIAATVAWDTISRRATLTPSAPLAPNTTYTATSKGGANGIADLAGNHLASRPHLELHDRRGNNLSLQPLAEQQPTRRGCIR